VPDQIGLCIWSPPEREEYLALARSPEFFGVPDEIVGKIQRKAEKIYQIRRRKSREMLKGGIFIIPVCSHKVLDNDSKETLLPGILS
jgi:hypothetical protein